MEMRKMKMRGSPLMATRARPACACSRQRAGRARAERSHHGERNEGGRRNGRESFREKERKKSRWLAPTGLPGQGRKEGDVAASQFNPKPRVLLASVTCRYTNICINTLLQNKKTLSRDH
jgi:hypothetical protein